MGEPVIGIIGSTGAVGRAVVRELQNIGGLRVLLGGRDIPAVRRLAETLKGPVDSVRVDVEDARSLAAFCRGCRVVVNCAGPSFRLLDAVARSAFAAGADYVDPGGDAPVYERLSGLDYVGSGRVALLTAGMMPGLSALLVRWLACQNLERTTRLTGYVGGRDRLSPGSAVDYVLNLRSAQSEALAEWRNGAKAIRALTPQVDASVQFFPSRVTAYPYLSAEAERLARALKLETLTWYNLFEGGHMLKALGRVQSAALREFDVEGAAADLVRAAALDLFGLPRYQMFLLQLEGEVSGRPAVRQLVLRGVGAHELTGSTSVLAVEALLRAEVGAGLHYAGEVLGTHVIEQLRDMSAVEAFHLVEVAEGEEVSEDGML